MNHVVVMRIVEVTIVLMEKNVFTHESLRSNRVPKPDKLSKYSGMRLKEWMLFDNKVLKRHQTSPLDIANRYMRIAVHFFYKSAKKISK